MPPLPQILLAGNIADRPAANTLPKGTLYSATDEGIVYQVSDTFTWNTWALVTAPGGIDQTVTTATLVGKTMTFTKGLLTGFA